jgi:hypothetical protein
MQFTATVHFQERLATRGLKQELLEFILVWGSEVQAAGARHFVVALKELPEEIRDTPTAIQAAQWVLVLSQEGVLLTCFRNRDALKFARTKPKDYGDTVRSNGNRSRKRRFTR